MAPALQELTRKHLLTCAHSQDNLMVEQRWCEMKPFVVLGWVLLLLSLNTCSDTSTDSSSDDIRQPVIHVPDDAPTIQAALEVARDGDTILVADGVYQGDGNRDLSMPDLSVVIRSVNGPAATIIDGQGGCEFIRLCPGKRAFRGLCPLASTHSGRSGRGLYTFQSCQDRSLPLREEPSLVQSPLVSRAQSICSGLLSPIVYPMNGTEQHTRRMHCL